ncbi:hypothetical protein GO013_11665 [Pseudodesulfovibrio sp. JC047]|uniref:hypothetical protein n=1 Tax=Pseudodesulfovibrio sp. JC047 TaxID=2683199 RepID=UPI0013D4199D|nr:hypothetical protein [Pseudodesulfovibrio sp. JC047]NDV20072.1 hypothetical protein [Pseudodesulfovibrio sp. JC047]
MKKKFVCIVVAFVCCVFSGWVPALAGDTFPTTLAGFRLGDVVATYSEYCHLEKAVPGSDAPFLSEAMIKPNALPGVRGGSLIFGNCLHKHELVGIKLKFHDRSKKLFDRLYKRYVKEFGEPATYVGDAFKNVIAWQWLFTNDEKEEVALVLMWSRSPQMRPGVSIKMTHKTREKQELDCYLAMDEKTEKMHQKSRVQSLAPFIPR